MNYYKDWAYRKAVRFYSLAVTGQNDERIVRKIASELRTLAKKQRIKLGVIDSCPKD